MGAAVVEVSGVQAMRWAAELRGVLAGNAGLGGSVSPVEVQRSAADVMAVIGLVFSGIGAAKTLWDWWQAGHRDGGTVTVVFSDGTRVTLSDVDLQQLEIVFHQAETQQR